MQINRNLGDRRAIAYVLEYFAGLAALTGQSSRAITLAGAASALRQEIGAPMSPNELVKLDELLSPANAQLSEIEQAIAYGQGRGMSMEQAVQYALEAVPQT